MSELHLRVFSHKSELVSPDGTIQVFNEGQMNRETKLRYKKITEALAKDYLEQKIIFCRDNAQDLEFPELNQDYMLIFNQLVESVTSEVGRALVGLTILQLCIKAIEPNQSIRLHKGSKGSKDFSWCDGISMRSLDKQYITPVLRKYDLIKLNAGGVMMTRSLAENYPYSPVYKANIKGAKAQWIAILEAIESSIINPESSLYYLILCLLSKAKAFQDLANKTIEILNRFLEINPDLTRESVKNMIWEHINKSDYVARIMEIAMHSLIQAMQDANLLQDSSLRPLSQMRSANKKHGNIGDIEILSNKLIIEVWDAKYGKTYLRDELEEMVDKLQDHSGIELAGFVTSVEPDRQQELETRRQDIEQLFGISLEILTFDNWVIKQFSKASEMITEQTLAQLWLIAYTESLAQKRRHIAPIDEPCYQWLATFKELLSIYSS